MKNPIRKLIPKFASYFKWVYPSYLYDLKRYYKYSNTVQGNASRVKLIGKIIMYYHSVEKGLTMPEFRAGFGEPNLLVLISECKTFILNYGKNDVQLQHAVMVIKEYKAVHDRLNFKLSDKLDTAIKELADLAEDLQPSIQKVITRDEYFKSTNASFEDFSHSRLSVRHYNEDEVSLEALQKAVDLSRNTPSACNRQTSHVYVYTDKEKIAAILKAQGGNRGFGHLANKLIIITAELGVYAGPAERNQAFIDGGMYAMNVLYALHYYKIAGCILNCSTSPEKDMRIRDLSGIAESESLIAMVSCGNVPDTFKVPLSKRYAVESVLTVIN